MQSRRDFEKLPKRLFHKNGKNFRMQRLTMPMVDSALNNRQINVPPRLPIILKQFCKAAIRTQPYDLLKWSSAYFRALAEGEEPPMKIRLEHPVPQSISGLTIGFLKVLLRQFGDYNKILPIEAIVKKWDDLCLDRRDLNLIMIIGQFRQKCQVKKFLAVAVGLLGSSLFETMLLICQLFTLEPDGGSAMIPVSLFMEIYGYLAGLRCDGKKRDSFEEDPSEFLIFDQPVNCNYSENQSSSRESTVEHPVELASLPTSQDTQVDITGDLESSFRDEIQSDDKQTRDDDTPKSSNLNDSTSKEMEPKLSKTNFQKSRQQSFQLMDSSTSSSKQFVCTEESSSQKSAINEDIDKNPDESSEKVATTNTNFVGPLGKNDDKLNPDSVKKKIDKDANTISYYPNIAGIGPRLLPEEVAAVAIWMTKCAKLQEGMVGPRNLRHSNCPPIY